MGIGFAIPTSTARQVLEAIVRDGEVVRGWIGIEHRHRCSEVTEGHLIATQLLHRGIRVGFIRTGIGSASCDSTGRRRCGALLTAHVQGQAHIDLGGLPLVHDGAYGCQRPTARLFTGSTTCE